MRARQRLQEAKFCTRLLAIAAEDRPIYMRWVPSHCGIDGNEAADALQESAASVAQDTAPLDVIVIYGAATGWYRELMGVRFSLRITNMDRAIAVDVHQMRTGSAVGNILPALEEIRRSVVAAMVAAFRALHRAIRLSHWDACEWRDPQQQR